ncbi:golgi uridine diphosphate-N-acetylglucosamine transporter [Stygiomarasmius scandens]|uniref:Golgi uridine diphosphate-N-acetylglucosamine transporter n=1 Tax=Marasmiellus scandens TaxID=2682957 RepID=A0ABR1JJH4_9AGAR
MPLDRTKSPSNSSSSSSSNGNTVNNGTQDPGIQDVPLATAASAVLDFSSIISMVLGGCCANVWAYEQLLVMNPRIGSALTFSQMLFITLQSLPSFLVLPPKGFLPRLKTRQVPLYQWALQVVVLSTGSLLNNWAFAFNVPLTVMIVFRSAGLAVSMLFGFLILKRRYSLRQVFSVVMVSIGVVVATLSKSSSKASSEEKSDDMHQYTIGIVMLVLSLVLSGILGILQEKTYKKYGPCWKEGVFYTHFLSLPVFFFLIKDVKQGLSSLSTASSSSSMTTAWLILGGNLVTQLICVSGVNRLTSRVSSVTTNLVLTTRKAISLCFSVWWFGSGWNMRLAAGAAMVFLGSLLFTLDHGSGEKKKKE